MGLGSSLLFLLTYLELGRDIRDKTIFDNWMYIPDNHKQNYPFFTLKLVVDTLEHTT